ncbi:NlpC/P60 family protein [Corynebacterium sp. 32222D000AT]|uniref:C40 family peptidase n=1 Tax=unclassified Corynebacterium TaxID=2624378 RepID=UPI002A922E99|nr:NlpC/P60 family protein [Mycobacteriaceae bacterium]MDY5828823.1 NlpC/P60 family protein [Corynebacterium sp.]
MLEYSARRTRSMRRISGGWLAATTAVVLGAAALNPVAGAQETDGAEQPAVAPAGDDVDSLLHEMGEVAQKVSAKSEKVKEAEDKLAEAEKDTQRSAEHARHAQEEADAADAAVNDQRGNVNDIAKSRYRGVNMDRFTATLASGDPQAAVERLGYLGAISRDAQRNLETMSTNADAAKSKRDAADAAVKEAERKTRELQEQKDRLVREQEELEKQKASIEERVDALSGEDRARWEAQFGGSSLSPEDIAGLSGKGGDAVAAALSKIGSPYGWGAAGPTEFDCSGLMFWAYQQKGVSIPRTSQAQIAGGTSVSINDLQPGDIVGYYPGVTHVGMYIGDGQVVHASTYGVPVQVVPVDSMPIQGASRY